MPSPSTPVFSPSIRSANDDDFEFYADDANDDEAAEQVFERAFHMTGVNEYLEYYRI